jgi:hypothetical protein
MANRYLFFLLAFTLSSGTLRAQESLESQTFKQRLRGQYLHNDTAQAIINLYGKRQAGGAGWIIASALTALRIATAGGSSTPTNGYVTRDTSNDGAVAALFALPFAAYGTGKILHYSNGKLDAALASYAAGKPLPRALKRKLKPRFFAQPIIKYQNVKVQPVK